MKKNWFPIILIIALLGLLAVLATLQYRWLGQISNSERVRLEKRLDDDAKRFTEDFNGEINLIYKNFQLEAQTYETREWGSFNKRYGYWKSKTDHPDLIKRFYFLSNSEDVSILEYNVIEGAFSEAAKTPQIDAIVKELNSQETFSPLLKSETGIAIPVYRGDEEIEKIITQTKESNADLLKTRSKFNVPEKYGYLLVVLNEEAFSKSLIPRLIQKYFSDPEGINYNVSIIRQSGKSVYKTNDAPLSKADLTTNIFSLSPNDFIFFSRDEAVIESDKSKKPDRVVVGQSRTISSNKLSKGTRLEQQDIVSVNIKQVGVGKPKIAVFEGKEGIQKGIWTLNVQHISGSLDQFVLNTRRKNLAISFGILGLLAASMILIFLSSQRAKLLAQRQIDFVSSVSHEFRTPLSVIYSAGENLSDGVIGEKEKVSTYGNLIKREGKKLSGMVEQILEFAGAKSGNRKYDLKETSVAEVLGKALEDCQPMIAEGGFEIEKDISNDIRSVHADENALTQAFQNLINNALKYSNQVKWVKISAENTKNGVRVSVEDRGKGISAKDRSQIFEPFYRAEDVVDEQISGNGLGLSLVKQIVEGHGGKISVESELGAGSKFIIDLAV